MGMIVSIYPPQLWTIEKEGRSLINPDDILCKVVIGYFEDVLSAGNVTEWISKDNLTKVHSGEYSWKIVDKYAEHPVRVYDQNGKEVTLIKKENTFDELGKCQERNI